MLESAAPLSLSCQPPAHQVSPCAALQCAIALAPFGVTITRLPLKRGATPGEIADGLMFILSARSMTGQMLALDGGQHLDFSDRRGPTPRR